MTQTISRDSPVPSKGGFETRPYKYKDFPLTLACLISDGTAALRDFDPLYVSIRRRDIDEPQLYALGAVPVIQA